MIEQRWSNEKQLPDEVRAAMRDVLAEALREAARKADPGDGSMFTLGVERTLGKGMWEGGWKLQASFVEDERVNDAPFVVIHAYKDSVCAVGSVASNVVRSADDRRFVAHQHLAALVARRDALNEAIDKLTNELEGGES